MRQPADTATRGASARWRSPRSLSRDPLGGGHAGAETKAGSERARTRRTCRRRAAPTTEPAEDLPGPRAWPSLLPRQWRVFRPLPRCRYGARAPPCDYRRPRCSHAARRACILLHRALPQVRHGPHTVVRSLAGASAGGGERILASRRWRAAETNDAPAGKETWTGRHLTCA